jgi:hypothetical protein
MPMEFYSRRGDCCGRQPREGEAIHPDLASDPDAHSIWKHVGWRVEAMRQLIAEDCPKDLRNTIYFAEGQKSWGDGGGAFVAYIRDKQRVGRLTRDHGYEEVGWPVVRRCLNGKIGFLEGTHRMATMRALGRPVAAILIERPDYKNNRLAEAKALQ